MATSLLALALAEAQLASLCLTTCLYGAFFAFFMVITAAVYHNASESARQQRMKVLPVSFTMFLLATFYIIVVWIRAKDAFIDGTGGTIEVFYYDASHPSNIVKLACLYALSFMEDSVIIYHMYIIFNKRFVIVAPAILLVVAYTVVAYMALNVMKNFRVGVETFDILEAWITAYFFLTMVTSILCSGAIALRLFVTGSSLPSRSMTTLWINALVIAESGMLYALSVIAMLTTFLSGSGMQCPAIDAIVLLVGILIIPQIRLYVANLTSPRGSGQLGTWPGPGHKAIDEDPKSPLRQSRMTVSVSNHTHLNLLEPISEIDLKSALLW